MKVKEPLYFYDKSTEQIIDYLVKEKITADDLKRELIFSDDLNSDNKTLIQKISFAEKRMSEPLEVSLKLFYLFFPFGVINFLTNEDDNFKRFSELRYIRKVRSYIIISITGAILYICLGLTLGFYFSK